MFLKDAIQLRINNLCEENNITIKVVALNDAIGDKYVAICSRYIPESQ